MQIFHEGGASSTQHDGITYEADGSGIIDVPQSIGELFVRRPGWHEVGWTPEVTDEEKAAADAAELIELRQTVEDLTGRLNHLERELLKRKTAVSK
jgi:hypothetical protein